MPRQQLKSAVTGNWGYSWHCAGYKKPRFFVRLFKAVGMYLGFIP